MTESVCLSALSHEFVPHSYTTFLGIILKIILSINVKHLIFNICAISII